MARKLTDIDVAEISLVDAAANRKKFFIKKQRSDSMDELLAVLKSFLGDDMITDAEIEKAKKAKLPPEVAKAIKDAVGTLLKYKADFPDDVLGAIQAVAKRAVLPDLPEEGELDIAKVGARLSKATLEEIRKLREILTTTLGQTAALKKAREIIDGLLESGTSEEKQKADDRYKDLPEDVRARLEKLDEIEEQQKAELKKAAEKREADLLNDIKQLKDDIEALKKVKGISKAAKGQEADASDAEEEKVKKGDVFPWPSLSAGKEV